MSETTFSVEVPAPSPSVIAYLSNVENFPLWATEFCQKLFREKGHYKVLSPMGELFLRIEANSNTGDIKFFATSDENGENYMRSRVEAKDAKSCRYSVEFPKPDDVDDVIYQHQCDSLRIELNNIRSQFS